MVEIFKALVDVLAKAIPALAGARRTKKLNMIGADLFVIYFRLNEVLVTAERIIEVLETYVERMGRHLADGSDPYALTAGKWIREYLERQSVNLTRVCELLNSHDTMFLLLDADAFHRLTPLIDWKGGAIRFLLAAVAADKLPTGPSADDLRSLMETEGLRFGDRHSDIVQHIQQDGIPIDQPWDEATYRVVVAYLRERDPKTQLAEIREAVGQVRIALLRHFSVEDMLLAVGDERFGT